MQYPAFRETNILQIPVALCLVRNMVETVHVLDALSEKHSSHKQMNRITWYYHIFKSIYAI